MIIYCTINKINGKIYIGKDSANNKYYLGSGAIFKKALKKYGKYNFSKIVLEECKTSSELNKQEQYWIKLLDSQNLNKGYNLSDGGEGGTNGIEPWNKGKKWSKEVREKISKSNSGKKKEEHPKWININIETIIELNNDGFSYKEIADKLGLKKQLIYKRLKDCHDIYKIKRKIDLSGNKNPNYKNVDVDCVVKLKKNGMKQKEICKYLNISDSTLTTKLKEKKLTWKSI